MNEPEPEIKQQIESLALESSKPLIIVDADEVLFLFVQGFERFLTEKGLWLDLQSFALAGNVKEIETNRVLDGEEVRREIKSFFARATHLMDPVPGAADALASLNRRASIVILSNLPTAQRDMREDALRRHGMPYPVVANTGLKGAAVRYMLPTPDHHVVFIDDIPHNLDSVRQAVPHATLVHFVADPRLAAMLDRAESCDHRIDTWPETSAIIHADLDEKGF